MSFTPRPVILLSTLVAVAAPAAAALVLSGHGATAAASSTVTATGSVSARVASAPHQVRLAPAAKPAVARKVAATHTAPVAAPKPAAKAAAPAPKPVATTAAAAAPAPKPVATTAAPTVRTADDYPWRTATTSDTDTWGFTKRQCVSFAAFRLAQHGHALNNATERWGSALNWDDVARARGVAVTSTPRVGAIAQWNAGEGSAIYSGSSPAGRFTAGSYGHVGYVAAVYADGSALIEQYNLGGDRSYSVMRMTAPRYLSF